MHSPSVTFPRPLVELRNVSKRFTLHAAAGRSAQESVIALLSGRRESPRVFWPLRDVSFAVQPAESLGIIGANGSGKSTLLKLIAGILDPTEGEVLVRGRVSSLLELGAGFHPELSGRENIFLNGAIFGFSRAEMARRLDAIIAFAELGDFIDAPVKHYSSGMYVRLGFAVAAHTDPDLLLVDEVLAVGDAAFQHKCLDFIYRFQAAGGTLLLVSHDLTAIQNICTQALWLEEGRVQALGKPTDVVMAYLSRVAQREEAAQGARPVAPGAEERRWGSREVEITAVELCDASGQPCTAFVTGSVWEVRIHYRAARRVEDPIFGLAVHHQGGAHICGPNTAFAGLYLPAAEGDGLVRYRVPRLPLLAGTYFVSVAAHNRADTVMYDYHDRVYPFRVYPGPTGERYGMFTLQGEWSVEGGAR